MFKYLRTTITKWKHTCTLTARANHIEFKICTRISHLVTFWPINSYRSYSAFLARTADAVVPVPVRISKNPFLVNLVGFKDVSTHVLKAFCIQNFILLGVPIEAMRPSVYFISKLPAPRGLLSVSEGQCSKMSLWDKRHRSTTTYK